MPFTVSLPGGPRDFEFEAYLRVLKRNGGNLADAPRVIDPVTRDRWVYAWANKTDAKRFAVAVRRESENDHWALYEVPAAEVTQGPLGPIEILVSRRSDGATYSLSPVSRTLIGKAFPEAYLVPTVFIASPIPAEGEMTHAPFWEYIALILTGLSPEQIKHLGGYRVIDWATQRVCREAQSLVA